MASAPLSQTVVSDPRWLCHRYDAVNDAFRFRRVDRDRHRAVPFLTDSDLGEDPALAIVARAEATALAPPAAPLHFIFHSAFCASTMLARALDVEGSAMGMSEPVLLNDLVGWRRRGATPAQLGAVMADSLRLLARPWSDGEAVVIKPSNVFNGLAPGALGLSPASKAILLTAPLPTFLASVARKGLHCRLWVRELLEYLLQDGLVDLGFAPEDYFRQTDLQVAAVGWLAQQAMFVRMLDRFGPARLATLGSERLTTDPAVTVAAVARFLGLARADPSDYADHPALVRDSKFGGDFTPGQRQADRAAAEQAHGDEIAKVMAWARAVAASANVPLTLPHALP